MTNTDSFIAEVKEEVRKDKLYRLFRRYAWIGVVIILFVVGGASFNEWRKSQQQVAAEAFGDSLLRALSDSDMETQLQNLANLEVEGEQRVLVSFATVKTLTEAEDQAAALHELATIYNDKELPIVYRHLAELKAIWLQADTLILDEQLELLSPLEEFGAPFRLLANETRAHILVKNNQFDEAVEILQRIQEEDAVPQALRSRVSQLLSTIETELTTEDASE